MHLSSHGLFLRQLEHTESRIMWMPNFVGTYPVFDGHDFFFHHKVMHRGRACCVGYWIEHGMVFGNKTVYGPGLVTY